MAIVGAGLAGSLLAVLLARRGYHVDLFERYPDPRRNTIPAGRSINLALAERGRAALHHADLLERVERFALPMAGRMLHDEAGKTRLQRYGQRADEVIWSVHRGHLNQTLLDAAEAQGVVIHFDRRLSTADFDSRRLEFEDSEAGRHRHDFELVIGCDGAGSALRQAMQSETELGVREQALGHGYLELGIPADRDGNFRMDPEALHIWPRGGFMMIALPNPDASFTCTLFLENDGSPGFRQLQDPADMRAFLEREFPDALALMPDLDRELAEHPVGFLGTLYVDQWVLDDKAVLMGDAAHAIVPFHGQGMNAAFEDTVALDRLLAEHDDRALALQAFQAERKPNADAIAAMALDNYLEMRDRVRDPRFHLQKALEWELEKALPGRFIPRYAMVMFHPEIPYAEAHQRGEHQARLLEQLTANHESLETIDLEAASAKARDWLASA
ncbi:MAG: FAD-dependent monooxygenase [Wenzhouxiangella sp.]|nr:MAG: FAD-dependent monooxygenase [Wenzhouxiangella sp.]